MAQGLFLMKANSSGLKAGLTPLPYVQAGMLLRHPDEPEPWRIVDIFIPTGANYAMAILRQGESDKRRIRCELLQDWVLMEDFNR